MFFEHLKSYVTRGLALDVGKTSTTDNKTAIIVKEKSKFDSKEVIYRALSSIGSPHGVSSMVKSLDTALLILRIAHVQAKIYRYLKDLQYTALSDLQNPALRYGRY